MVATSLLKKVMVIAAHPDDPEFSCAGTIAKWIAEGQEVVYVLCTSGNKGTKDLNLSPNELAATREREQEAAAQELGVSKCIFLRHNDGQLEVTMLFRAELCLVLRQERPDVVVTHDPWIHYQIHPDHTAAGFTAIYAVAAARDHLYFPEQLASGLQPHRVRELLLFRPQEPNFWVDISSTFDKKIAALRCHESQVTEFEGLEERLRQWAMTYGESQGIPLAEHFHRIELPSG